MISVVVPALNEAGNLGARLEELAGETGVEIVVADGGSDDGTAELVRARGARVVAAPRGRARQMNAGAAAARGEVLLFLHADTRLPAGFPAAVTEALADPRAAGGAFTFALDGRRPFYRFIERTTNFRSRRLGIVFGDQAIFARAGVFREIGGYPDQRIMEDAEIVRRLRARGRFVILPGRAVTSARRWEESGPVRTSLLNVLLTWAWRVGVAPGVLARLHRDLR